MPRTSRDPMTAFVKFLMSAPLATAQAALSTAKAIVGAREDAAAPAGTPAKRKRGRPPRGQTATTTAPTALGTPEPAGSAVSIYVWTTASSTFHSRSVRLSGMGQVTNCQ